MLVVAAGVVVFPARSLTVRLAVYVPFGTIAPPVFRPSQAMSTGCAGPGGNDPTIVRTTFPLLSRMVTVYRSGLASPIVVLRIVVVGTVEAVPGAMTGVV